MKNRGDLFNALSVHDPRNKCSDLGTVLVRRCAAFEQPDRICIVNGALDSSDKRLMRRFHSPILPVLDDGLGVSRGIDWTPEPGAGRRA